jgi:hypothetical protein
MNPNISHLIVPVAMAHRRSAGFQPAVSPISNRHGVRTALDQAPRLRVGNPRYSGLEICATPSILVCL